MFCIVYASIQIPFVWITDNVPSIQRKPKISASRKLMLKVNMITDLVLPPVYHAIHC